MKKHVIVRWIGGIRWAKWVRKIGVLSVSTRIRSVIIAMVALGWMQELQCRGNTDIWPLVSNLLSNIFAANVSFHWNAVQSWMSPELLCKLKPCSVSMYVNEFLKWNLQFVFHSRLCDIFSIPTITYFSSLSFHTLYAHWLWMISNNRKLNYGYTTRSSSSFTDHNGRQNLDIHKWLYIIDTSSIISEKKSDSC